MELPTGTPTQRLARLVALRRVQAEFGAACEGVVRTVVDDLLLPPAARRLTAVDAGGVAGGEKFIHNGVFFKFARDWKGLYGGDEFAMKAAALEVNNLRALWLASQRAVAAGSDAAAATLRIPVACQVDYAGYRAVCLSLLPIGAGTLVYGSADAGRSVVADGDAAARVAGVATQLNLKPHEVAPSGGGRACELALCADIEVHAGRDGRMYVVDTARVFPPEAPSAHLTAFLLAGQRGEGGGSGASFITRVDISRASSQDELAAILMDTGAGAGGGGGGDSGDGSGRRPLRRIPLAGAALFIRGDVNAHVAGGAPVPPGAHRRLQAEHGVNHVAAAMLDAFAISRGLLHGMLLPIYGDAIIVVGERGQHLYNCLRGEYLYTNPLPLSSDVFTQFGRPGAARHNAEAGAATTRLLRGVLPALAADLLMERLRTTSLSGMVDTLHAAGVNVRHAGVLRVLMAPPAAIRRGQATPVLRRVRALLLVQMVVRVIKQLVRHALRYVSAAGLAAGGGAPGAARPDARLVVLNWVFNVVLAPVGPWAPSAVSSAAAADAPPPTVAAAANTFWTTIVKVFLELKFSVQSPSLTPAERAPDHDFRAALSRAAVLAAVCEQVGIDVTPALAARLEGASPLLAPPPGSHPHDPLLLPRLLRRSRAGTADGTRDDKTLAASRAAAAAARPPPNGDVATPAWAFSRTALGGDDAHAENNVLPSVGRVLVHAPWSAVDPVMTLNEAERFGAVSPPGAPPRPAALLAADAIATWFGVNYGYTMQGTSMNLGRDEKDAGGSAYVSRVAQYSSYFNEDGVARPREGRGGAPDIEVGDVVGLRVLAKPIVSDADVAVAAALHPFSLGPSGLLATALSTAAATTPCFDVTASSPCVALMHGDAPLVDIDEGRLPPPGAAAAPADDAAAVLASPTVVLADVAVVAPPTTAALAGGTPFGYALTNVAVRPVEAAERAPAAGTASWDIVLHAGYDTRGLHVGVVSTPVALAGSAGGSAPSGGPGAGWWLFAADTAQPSYVNGVPVGDAAAAAATPAPDAAAAAAAASHAAAPPPAPPAPPAAASALKRAASSTGAGAGAAAAAYQGGADANLLTLTYHFATARLSLAVNGAAVPAASLTEVACKLPLHSRTTATSGAFGGVGTAVASELRVVIATIGAPAGTAYRVSLARVTGGFDVVVWGGARYPGRLARSPAPALAADLLHLATCTTASASGSAAGTGARAAVARAVHPAVTSHCASIVATVPALAGWTAVAGATFHHAQLVRALGRDARPVVDAALDVAAAVLHETCDAAAAAAAVAAAFDTGGLPDGLVPLHAAVRGYTLLGDACLLAADAPPAARWRGAEAWYARAWTLLAASSPDTAALAEASALLEAAHTAPGGADVSSAKYSTSTSFCRDASPPETWQVAMHPHALVVLDRLIGVVRAASRHQHAASLQYVFLKLWDAHGCPLRPHHFVHPDASWVGAPTSPYIRVFGRAFPAAAGCVAEGNGVYGRLGCHTSWDAFTDAVQELEGGSGGSPPSTVWPAAAAVEGWVGAVGSMEDQGFASDVRVPPGLGLVAYGPHPARLGTPATTPPSTRALVPAGALGAPGVVYVTHRNCPDMELLFTRADYDPAVVMPPDATAPSVTSRRLYPPGTVAPHRTDVPQLADAVVSLHGASGSTHMALMASGRVALYYADTSCRGTAPAPAGVGETAARARAYHLLPLRTLAGKRITTVAPGAAFVALLSSDGQVYTFGANDDGALGHGDTAPRAVPTVVRGLEGGVVAHLAAGTSHVVAAAATPRADGCSLWAWGTNAAGCCGQGADAVGAVVSAPQAVQGMVGGVPPSSGIAGVAAAGTLTLLLLTSGAVAYMGRLTFDTDGESLKPASLPTLLPFADDPLVARAGSSSTGGGGSGGDESNGKAARLAPLAGAWVCPPAPPTIAADAVQPPIVRVVAGNGVAVAFSADGRMFTVGVRSRRGDGRLPTLSSRRVAVRVPGVGPVARFAALPPATRLEAALCDSTLAPADAVLLNNCMLVVARDAAVDGWAVVGSGAFPGTSLQGLESLVATMDGGQVWVSDMRPLDFQRLPLFAAAATGGRLPLLTSLDTEQVAILDGGLPVVPRPLPPPAAHFVTLTLASRVVEMGQPLSVTWGSRVEVVLADCYLVLTAAGVEGGGPLFVMPLTVPVGRVTFTTPTAVGTYELRVLCEAPVRRALSSPTQFTVATGTGGGGPPALAARLLMPVMQQRLGARLVAVMEPGYRALPWWAADIVACQPAGQEVGSSGGGGGGGGGSVRRAPPPARQSWTWWQQPQFGAMRAVAALGTTDPTRDTSGLAARSVGAMLVRSGGVGTGVMHPALERLGGMAAAAGGGGGTSQPGQQSGGGGGAADVDIDGRLGNAAPALETPAAAVMDAAVAASSAGGGVRARPPARLVMLRGPALAGVPSGWHSLEYVSPTATALAVRRTAGMGALAPVPMACPNRTFWVYVAEVSVNVSAATRVPPGADLPIAFALSLPGYADARGYDAVGWVTEDALDGLTRCATEAAVDALVPFADYLTLSPGMQKQTADAVAAATTTLSRASLLCAVPLSRLLASASHGDNGIAHGTAVMPAPPVEGRFHLVMASAMALPTSESSGDTLRVLASSHKVHVSTRGMVASAPPAVSAAAAVATAAAPAVQPKAGAGAADAATQLQPEARPLAASAPAVPSIPPEAPIGAHGPRISLRSAAVLPGDAATRPSAAARREAAAARREEVQARVAARRAEAEARRAELARRYPHLAHRYAPPGSGGGGGGGGSGADVPQPDDAAGEDDGGDAMGEEDPLE